MVRKWMSATVAMLLMAPVAFAGDKDKGKDKNDNKAANVKVDSNKDNDKDKKEKDSEGMSFKKALAEAQAADKANADQRFDFVVAMDPEKISFNEDIGKLKGQGYVTHRGVKMGGYNIAPSMTDIETGDVFSAKMSAYAVGVGSYLKAKGSDAMVMDCNEKARFALAKGQKLQISVRNAPRHSLFVTQVELLKQWGQKNWKEKWDKKMRADEEMRKKRKIEKRENLKKFMQAIDDVMVPRRTVGFNTDKIEAICQYAK